MNEYTVNLEVSYGGYTFDTSEIIDAESVSEAREVAIEKVRDNLLINATEAETDEEETGEDFITFTVSLTVEHGGSSLDATEEVEAYTNSEALIEAESKVQDNVAVFALDVENNEE